MRENKLRMLYFWLWKSADFEADLYSEWKEVYLSLCVGEADFLDDVVIDMVYLWATEWWQVA